MEKIATPKYLLVNNESKYLGIAIADGIVRIVRLREVAYGEVVYFHLQSGQIIKGLVLNLARKFAAILIFYQYFIKLLEYSILIIVSIQSMYLLLISNNWGRSYLLLELISICFYILRVLVSNLKRGKNKLALNKYYFRLLKKNKKKCI